MVSFTGRDMFYRPLRTSLTKFLPNQFKRPHIRYGMVRNPVSITRESGVVLHMSSWSNLTNLIQNQKWVGSLDILKIVYDINFTFHLIKEFRSVGMHTSYRKSFLKKEIERSS